MGLLLGVDIGSSSSKAVLASGDGEVLATAERAHAVERPAPGWAEHDADGTWWGDTKRLCHDLGLGPRHRVAAVCVSGIGPCLLLADSAGRPLRPAILYGIDTRAVAQIRALGRRLGSRRILEVCGSPLTSQAVGPKLAWVQQHEPDVWARSRRFYMASSYVVHRLCGAYVLDHHSASQCVPMYDLGRLTWHHPWAQRLAGSVRLPRLVWPAEQVGTVSAAAERSTGITRGAAVCAGTIDAWAESVSVGVREPGDTCLMYGSTTFLVQQVGAPRPDPRLWTTVGVRPGTLTLAAGMATTGSVTEWLRQLMGSPPWPALYAEAERVPPGSLGLVTLPYFAGERTPIFDGDARGLIIGLSLEHGRGALFRSLLEGVAFGVRHNLEVMGEVSGLVPRLLATGGGARNRPWLQIVSDVTGLPQRAPGAVTSAAHGDMLLARSLLPSAGPAAVPEPEGELIRPDPTAAAAYADGYDVYRRLYPRTRGLMHRTAALQRRAGTASVGVLG
ncbi:MAG TPA: FGGY family carbohydrate kinase [Verrucomicrobiae bacterium]|nr:FGGY family carbohydrate kinase [Verrucomicrobiae bacterium]